jgi:hypothetical protein
MKAKDLIFDQGREGEVVEEIGKILPNVCIAVLAQAFVVEAVDLSNLTRLVVTAKDGYSLRIANLESYKQGDGFDRKVATVNIVALMAVSKRLRQRI